MLGRHGGHVGGGRQVHGHGGGALRRLRLDGVGSGGRQGVRPRPGLGVGEEEEGEQQQQAQEQQQQQGGIPELKKYPGGAVRPEDAEESPNLTNWPDGTAITFATPIQWVLDDIARFTGLELRLV